jgi:short-subunit dehydrogenase
MQTALIVGSTDGIGLALTELLLMDGFRVIGVSRRESPQQTRPNYEHHVADVGLDSYADTLREIVRTLTDLSVCVYCAGIGEMLDVAALQNQMKMFRVNLLGAVTTAEVVLPKFVAEKQGHFMGLSSQGDTLLDPAGAGYAASKAALSTYLEGLAFICRVRGVAVTNVRLGFVDTKMAKSAARPFMVSAQTAAQHVRHCMRTKPLRSTFPRRLAPLLWLVKLRLILARF